MKNKLMSCLLLTLALTFSACGNKGEESDSEKESKTQSKKESVSTEQEIPDEEDMENLAFKRGENVYCWLSGLTTGTPNELSAINSHVTSLPVTEDSLNAMGEFRVNLAIDDDFNTTFSNAIDYVELTGLGTPFCWNESDNHLVEDNGVKLVYHTHKSDTDNDLLFQRDMFDQGYWYLETKLDEHNSKKVWNESTSTWDLFDYYIEVLGKPSYVRVHECMVERLEKEGAKYYDNYLNEQYIEYNKLPEDEQNGFVMFNSLNGLNLIWEYDEYVLYAPVYEMFMASDYVWTNYMSSDIYELRYYPKEQWYSYWKTEMGEELVDMYLFEDHGEVIDNNIPKPTPKPKVEPCVLPEGDFAPCYSADMMILEVEGEEVSLVDKNSWNVINELGIEAHEEYNYIDVDEYDNYTNGIPRDYLWDFYGYKYLSLMDKKYNQDNNDVRMYSITVDNQHLDKVPEIVLFGLDKDTTIKDVYELFGNPDYVDANSDEDGNCTMKFGNKKDLFITDTVKMEIYIKFIENKFSKISIDFKYTK